MPHPERHQVDGPKYAAAEVHDERPTPHRERRERVLVTCSFLRASWARDWLEGGGGVAEPQGTGFFGRRLFPCHAPLSRPSRRWRLFADALACRLS